MIRLIKELKPLSLGLFLCLGLFISSCSCDEDCATISNFKLCDTEPTSDGCETNLSVFAQDADYISVSVEIEDAKPEYELILSLFIEENGNLVKVAEYKKKISEIDNIDGDEKKIRASTGFPRNAGALLPIADYQVQLELIQEVTPLNATQNFSVQ